MKIAFVLAGLSAGGAERVITKLAGEALYRGWDVTIITFDLPDDPIFHALDPRVKLQRLGLPAQVTRSAAVVTMVRRFWRLRQAIYGQYDVIISFLTKINVLTLFASAGSKVPVIVSERNNPDRQTSHPLWRLALHRLYPRAAAIVMLTNRGRERLKPAERERAIVIPNPIPMLPFRPRTDGPPQLVAVGRLNEQKGFDLLIAAFAQVADRFPEWKLIIYGEGGERSALEKQVQSHGLAGRVSLPGTTKAHGEWIEAANLFVLSSRYEGFANVIGEAMQAGLAVIAYDCDFGPSDMIEHDVSGILVPPENVEKLGKALAEMMSNPDRRQQIGHGATQRVELFNERAVLSRWMHAIEAAL